mgnify:CR=1 FL=1
MNKYKYLKIYFYKLSAIMLFNKLRVIETKFQNIQDVEKPLKLRNFRAEICIFIC